MKKLLVLLLPIALVSCESKLPANISSAVYGVELGLNMTDEIDSLILTLNKESIDKLNSDSLSTLIARSEVREEQYRDAKKELEDLLKYNPEYSDHSRIKSIRSRYMYKNIALYYDNLDYITARRFYVWNLEKGYKPALGKPVYGE